MAEYVVEYPDDLIAEGYVEACVNVHERIVRCRDCKHYDSAGYYTDYSRELQEHSCFYFQDYEGSPAPVEPNGFCSWGERREG